MKKSWTNGLDTDAAKEIRMSFSGSVILRKRLELLLRIKEEEASKDGRSKSGYDCPNWAYKQADLVGYNRAINDIIELIKNN